jgi:photosystem II stability/assembly factor-like uncharacterized protein
MTNGGAASHWFAAGTAPFAALTWRELGPWRGGRVQAVTGHSRDPDLFYFGSTGGGVWRSGDAGATWRNISDGFFRSGPVGAIAVSDADPDTIYAGTGEGGLRNNVTGGDGVYRSRDGGVTWGHVGLAATQNIARIRIDPRDPDRVFVAATGHRFGPNEERGIFRSRDGGATWERTLFVDAATGAADLSLDPQNPRFLYAATWRAGRTPWGFTAGGAGSGLWRSSDGGTSWASLADAPGLPRGPLGRIAVAVSPADSRRVYALIEAETGGGLYRSSDRGLSWSWVSAEPNLLVRPWYLAHLVADPRDPDTVYVPNRKLWKSRDGGRSWQQLNTTYWDQHDLWLDPRDPRRMILGNDGGAAISRDGGTTWSTPLNQPTAELYHVATDTRFPYRVYGAQQDNSTISLPTRSVNGPISQADWFDVGGGESGHIAVRPDNPDIVYAASYAGEVTRYDHASGDLRTIAVWPEGSDGWGARDLRHRFNWSTPVVLSPHDPDTLYVAGERVFRSRDEGATWAAISPDLTRDDPTMGARAGGPITYDSAGTDYYCTIMAFAESPVGAGVLWVGSDDGLVHLSRDAGASWTDVTPPGVPEWANIAAIEPSPHDAATAYVAATAHRLDDFAPYLFRTTDRGATWTPIVAGLPPDRFLRAVRADPGRRGLLYAGGEGGVWVSLDDGVGWSPFRQNLPITPIYDLAVKDGDLIAATHGRGFWVLDDLTPLHDAAPSPAPYLFPPRPVVRVAREAYHITSLIALGYPHGAAGPDYGVWFHYLLPAGFADEVTLTILDPAGLPIRTFTSVGATTTDAPLGPYAHRLRGAAATLTARGRDEAEPGVGTGVLPPEMQARPQDGSRLPRGAGLNRFVWDLRYPEAETLPGRNPGGITAPLAPPGTYRARLTVAGRGVERSFAILPDPRLDTTAEGYAAQFALLLGLRDRVTALHRTVGLLHDLRAQTHDRLARLGGDTVALADARAACESLVAALDGRERALLQPRIHDRAREQEGLNSPVGLDAKLASLGYFVAKSDRTPTAAQEAVYADLATRAEAAITAARALLATPLAALNGALLATGTPPIAPPGRDG